MFVVKDLALDGAVPGMGEYTPFPCWRARMAPQRERGNRNREDLTPAERLDALAEIFADGVISLAETGQLMDLAVGHGTDGESGDMALTSGGNEGTSSCGARGTKDGGEAKRGGCGGG